MSQTTTQSSTLKLSLQDVIAISRTYRSTKTRTRRQAYYLAKLAADRLKAATEGRLILDPEVKTPHEAVVRMLWRIYKVAKEQWRAAKAAEAGAEPTGELANELAGEPSGSPEQGENLVDFDSPYAEENSDEVTKILNEMRVLSHRSDTMDPKVYAAKMQAHLAQLNALGA